MGRLAYLAFMPLNAIWAIRPMAVRRRQSEARRGSDAEPPRATPDVTNRPDNSRRADADLEQRLTAGYAQAHELETLALQLEREGARLLTLGASAERLRSVMRRRHDVHLELAGLRKSLEALRAAPGVASPNDRPSA